MAKKKPAAKTRVTKSSKASKATPSTKSSKSSKSTTRRHLKPKSKTKPKLKSKSKSKSKSSGATVDAVLKTFEKERLSLNDKLGGARKKVEQLSKQIEKLKGQLDATRREIVESELAIATLDARRDKEIGVLLSGLGVDLGKVAAAAKPKPAVNQSTPLFDGPEKNTASPAATAEEEESDASDKE